MHKENKKDKELFVKILAKNVNSLLELHERKQELYKSLLELSLVHLQGNRFSRETSQQRKELIEVLKELTK